MTAGEMGETVVRVGKIRPGRGRKLALAREKCCSAFNGKGNRTPVGGSHRQRRWSFPARAGDALEPGLGLLCSCRCSVGAGCRGLAQSVHGWGGRPCRVGGLCGSDPTLWG